MSIILDTGPLVTILIQADDYHYWSTQQLTLIKQTVITETIFLLKKRTVQEYTLLSLFGFNN